MAAVAAKTNWKNHSATLVSGRLILNWYLYQIESATRVLLERAVGKTRTWKFLSSKVRNEIGKNEIGKFEPKMEKFVLLDTALKTFQHRSVLFNLNEIFLHISRAAWSRGLQRI